MMSTAGADFNCDASVWDSTVNLRANKMSDVFICPVNQTCFSHQIKPFELADVLRHHLGCVMI
jgi:hypothetical protein